MPQYGPVGAFPIKGKIVLITGGGSGIGLSLTRLLHTHGAHILIADLALTPEATAWTTTVPPATVHFVPTDVSSWPALHLAITASVTHFGRTPDIYTPIAGIFEPTWSNFWDDSEALAGSSTYATLAINTAHPIQLTRLALRACVGEKKQGVVVLVASTAGVRGNYLSSLYCASKHAVVGFAKSMGQLDAEEGVRVACVCPGLVATRLWTDRDESFRATNRYDERKQLSPDDVAEVMLKMVLNSQGEYSGGTVVLKTPYEERVLEEGWEKRDKGGYDPSPRPEADLRGVKELVERERGVSWGEKRLE